MAEADREDYEVRFSSIDGKRAPVKVGAAWKRYHWAVRTPADSSYLHATILPIGSMLYDGPPAALPVLWLDAVQFEEGTEPTEYVPDAYNLDNTAWMSLE